MLELQRSSIDHLRAIVALLQAANATQQNVIAQQQEHIDSLEAVNVSTAARLDWLQLQIQTLSSNNTVCCQAATSTSPVVSSAGSSGMLSSFTQFISTGFASTSTAAMVTSPAGVDFFLCARILT